MISGWRWAQIDADLFGSADGRRIGFRRDSGRVSHLTMGSWKVMERVR